MKRIMPAVPILLLCAFLFGCAGRQSGAPAGAAPTDVQEAGTGENDKNAVSDLVREFGKKLQMVSLLAPGDILDKSMAENYGEYVTPELLEKWKNNPGSAPGRTVSSPWPDRIEILSVEKISDDEYEVKGEIIEETSAELKSGGAAAGQPITLNVIKSGECFLIDGVMLGDYEQDGTVVYKNTDYGFDFTLPESWTGYTIVNGEWEGLDVGDSQGEKVVETGPMISIRHPDWSLKNPRQDIPVMVFAIDQWNALQKDQFHIGAAPIGPSELGRNSEYVFALPARYNFAFPTGYEEVETILKNKPLHPTEDISAAN